MNIATTSRPPPPGFRHEALLYDGDASFLKATVPFIESGREGDEAVLVVVSSAKIDLLKSALGPNADGVSFADMDNVGMNHARIIPAWRNFADENQRRGRPMRGIGEPIWPTRAAAELAECHHHEALINVAFANTMRFWLLCPYNTTTLGPDVVERMAHTHPFLTDGEQATASDVYDFQMASSHHFLEPLPDPPRSAVGRSFSMSTLRQLRGWVASLAGAAGLGSDRTGDLVLAVGEVASNSVRHGGGTGRIRFWEEDSAVVCDISDSGHSRQPLAGRQLPGRNEASGRGLWLANQVCDLVQIRSSPAGTLVRLRQSKTPLLGDKPLTV